MNAKQMIAKLDGYGGIIPFNSEELEVTLRALRLLAAAEANDVAAKYSWECNECGSQEYSMSVSEDDVQKLGCSNCGGDEWHKARSK